MNLDQKLLACESTLARLDAAMTSAEAEAIRASALEDHLRRLLDNLEAGQARLGCTPHAVARTSRHDVGQPCGRADAADEAFPLDLPERVAPLSEGQGKLPLLSHSEEA